MSAFDGVAPAYDRSRPRYPAALYADLFAYLRGDGDAGDGLADAPGAEAGDPPAVPTAGEGPVVLEIGPGTGQATIDLLAAGASVTAVELGPNLAAFLKAKFAGEPRLRVVNAAFEDVDLAFGSFDLAVTATAFHWLDPAVRLVKSAALLRPRGVLAVIDTNQVRSPADRGFFERCFPVYLRYRPGERNVEVAMPEDVVPAHFAEIANAPSFTDVRLWRYRWDQRYTTSEYADLVRSYSNTEAMRPPPVRAWCATSRG